MLVLGILGSPRINGNCSKLLTKALEGARSTSAETKRIDLISKHIEFCRGCSTCVYENHELPIGKCPQQDDMESLLEEYVQADGYIFATPVYDGFVTALMKMFLERKIALMYRDPGAYGKIPAVRRPADFKKCASMIVTGNCSDEYREVMGDPCFEGMEAHLMIEQVLTIDKFYVGGVENITQQVFSEKLDEAYRMGVRLVEEIGKAQAEN